MLFRQDHRDKGAEAQRLYAAYEIAYTVVDFTAALTFIIGSVMFFFAAWTTVGTWLFLAGSICFALKPTIRLVREVKLAAVGDAKDLAERLGK